MQKYSSGVAVGGGGCISASDGRRVRAGTEGEEFPGEDFSVALVGLQKGVTDPYSQVENTLLLLSAESSTHHGLLKRGGYVLCLGCTDPGRWEMCEVFKAVKQQQ